MAHFKNEAKANSGLVLTYEKMVAEPATTLKRVLEFARLPFDENAIDVAVAKSSFNTMKRTVAETGSLPAWLLPTSDSEHSQKVRDGGRTPLSNYYDSDDLDFAEETWTSFGHGEYGESFGAARLELGT